MCGVFGFFLNEPLTDSDLEAGKSSTQKLSHRGPDNTGYWYDRAQGIFLGHTRLSILDVSEASHQPMVSDRYAITFNGEIYNYKELQNELKEKPDADGDTGTLLRLWEEKGKACLDKLDGMFAFAIYDSEKRNLTLATDPFGEKPLYYLKNSKGFYFSSEPGPLIELLNLSVSVDEKSISEYLIFGFLTGENTGYNGLNSAGPAKLLEVDKDSFTIRQYWTPPTGPVVKGTVKPLSEDNLDSICDKLIESLNVRLRTDVPLTIFLSAGIDSSLVAALTKKELNQDINCLTVSFPDDDVRDESLHAQKIAEYLGLPHEIIEGGEDPTRENHQLIYDMVGEVNSNTTVGAVYLLSEAARKKYKVALCGLGGDELFFGYNKYRDLYRANLTKTKLKSFVKKLGGSNTFNLSGLSSFQQIIAIRHLKNYKELQSCLSFNAADKNYNDLPGFLAARYFDLTQTMPHSYILGMERASMRTALELRTPFLNKALYELLAEYDARAFVHFGRKDVAKRILKRYLPENLLKFPKNGFRSTVQTLFKERPKVQVSEKLYDTYWQRKNDKYFEVVASRMVTLDHFLSL